MNVFRTAGLATTLMIAATCAAQQQPAAPAPKPSQALATTAKSAGVSAVSAAAVPINSDDYVLGPEDVLAINVWKEPDVTRTVPVRPDGKISLPLVGEVKAEGLTPGQLRAQLAQALAKYIDNAEVAVIVQQAKSHKFNIVGEVQKPGAYPLDSQTTVLDALALAGGLRDFAKTKDIYILRTQATGSRERLPFNYKNVIRGKNPEQNVVLQPHDTIVVP
jgi:polysaccharide biosynthesis/export protein